MSQPSLTTGRPALTTPNADEALRRAVATPVVTPRRLIAAGMKRGTGRLIVQAVAA